MAIATRGGQVDGVIFHTDRGSEYTSGASQQLCGRRGVVQSMGRVGSALDNAAAESFHSASRRGPRPVQQRRLGGEIVGDLAGAVG
ncbi:DDE-type integrase/transposase/recombinase [Streptomyces sp. NPDC048665]|uniref:DDE-type integrase/transposase/recombinase n=1 Tax=Streptomyces sp. NPDC048665 TaxID=3155490 RepID=UPI00341F2F3A